MLLDPFECSQRQRECVPTFQTRHRRRLMVTDRCYKSKNLSAQRLYVDYIEIPGVNSRPRPFRRRWRQVANRGVLGCVVDSDVIMWLEKAHFANFFRAYARGRNICYGPGRKLNPRIRGVDSCLLYTSDAA